MIGKDSKIAIVLNSGEEIDCFSKILKEKGFRNIKTFIDSEKAYEYAIRNQIDLFITRMEMPKITGIVFIQKIRSSGNYGLENHLFVCDNINNSIVNVLSEFDVPYVLTKPFNKNKVSQKLDYLISRENNQIEFDQQYRDAKAALWNSHLLEMAYEIVTKMNLEYPENEKIKILIGDISIKMNDIQNGKKFYEKALEINPNSNAALHKLANIHMITNNFEKAAEILDKLALTNHHHIQILENAGLSNLETGNLDAANSYAERVQKLDHKNKVSTEININVNIKQGNYGQIIEKTRKHSFK